MEIPTVQGQSSIICEYLFCRKVYALCYWCGVQFYETKSEIKQTTGTQKKERKRKTGKINRETQKGVCYILGLQSPYYHCGGLTSIPGQAMWDL